MPPKKEKRPSRLAWFAFYVDAFLEDERMQTLTNKEKSAWAMLLIRGFRNKGMIVTDPSIIAEQTGLSNKESKVLVSKLLENNLVNPTGKTYQAISNKLMVEYLKARESYDRFSEMGKLSAEKNGDNNLHLVK